MTSARDEFKLELDNAIDAYLPKDTRLSKHYLYERLLIAYDASVRRVVGEYEELPGSGPVEYSGSNTAIRHRNYLRSKQLREAGLEGE